MLVDPAYPDVQSDERLVSVTAEMLRLQTEIQDADWEGRDATVLRQKFKRLNSKLFEGVNYESCF